jgi:hypothetical protein
MTSQAPIHLAMGGSIADDFGVYDKSDVTARERLLSSPFRTIAARYNLIQFGTSFPKYNTALVTTTLSNLGGIDG